MLRNKVLVAQNIKDIDAFVAGALETYKNGNITLEDAVSHIGHVISAVDMGNETEYVSFPRIKLKDYKLKG